MAYKKNHKRRLTKFGKIFFGFTIVSMVGTFCLCLNHFNIFLLDKKNVDIYKEEADNYLIEINYPKVNNKSILAYANEYLQNKEKK